MPFAVAVECGVAAMMTAHVAYPALDPSGLPATLSRGIMDGLRRTLGFDGLVVTDALIMDGALVGRRESDAAVEARAVGRGPAALSQGPAAGARRAGERGGERRAAARADRGGAAPVRARGRGRDALDAAGAPRPVRLGGRRWPTRCSSRAWCGATRRGSPGPLDLVVVDDDVGGPYPPSPSDYTAKALGPELAGRYTGGSRVVLVFAEPRAWKGRAGFGDASREALASYASDADLIVLFGHPRLVEQLPSDAPVLLAWHRQRLMQEAVARWLRARIR